MAFVIKIKYENSLRRLTFLNEIQRDELTFGLLETRIRELFELTRNAEVSVTYMDRDGDLVTMANDQDLKDALVHQSLNPLRLDATLVSSNSPGHNGVRQVEKENITATEPSRERLKTTEIQSLRQLIQSYEPMNEKVASPAQVRALVENLVQAITSSIASAAESIAITTSKSHDPVRHAPRQESENVAKVGVVKLTRMATLPGFEAEACIPEAEKQSAVTPEVVHVGVTCDVCGISPIVGIRWKSIKKYDYDLCSSCFEKKGNVDDYTRIEQPMFRPRHLHPQRMMRMSGPGGATFHPMGSGCQVGFHGGKPYGMRGPFGGRCSPVAIPGAYGGKLDARFVRDVTMFDGTEVTPSSQFTKIWRLRNSGSVVWPAKTKLVHVGGDELGKLSMVLLEIPEQGLAPEEEIEVSVDLVAPEKPGRYVSHWRLASPYGPKFGHRVWVHIQVVPTESLEYPVNLDFAQNGSIHPVDQTANFEFAPVVENEAQMMEKFESTEKGAVAPEVGEAQTQNAGKILEPTFSFVNVETATEETASENTKEKEANLPAPAGKVSMTASGSNVGSAISMLYGLSSAAPASAPAVGDAAQEYLFKFDVEQESVSQTHSQIDKDVARNADYVDEIADTETATTAAAGVEDLSSPKALLTKLEAMGFADAKLNLELLEKNNFDLRKTLDDLCAADEWDPILEELEEMGFYDTEMNRRLMFKNNGSVKRVVKDLVHMYKNVSDAKGKTVTEK